MLDYEWGNPTAMMFTGEETVEPEVEQNRQYYDQSMYSAHALNEANAALYHHTAAQYHHAQPQSHHHSNNVNHFAFHQLDHHSSNSGQLSSIYDPRASYGGASSYAQHHASLLSLAPTGSSGFVVVPKSEPMVDFNAAGRIGLNLGGRTYFSSSEDDFVSRLYRRSRLAEPGSVHSPRCQAENCTADLTNAKHYHRRHKVCEFHSKAATVIASGLTQRFCQQCSRFHLLSEFDNGKRSCRKRLADHNRRRRKSQQQQQQQTSQENGSVKPPQNSKDSSRSPPESSSGAHSSSVTVAISSPSPRISLDCFVDRPSSTSYQGSAPATTNSSASTSSLFFSDGL